MSVRILSIDQVARALRVKPLTLARWRRRGEGPPSLRMGRRGLRYVEADLERWLEDQGMEQR